LASSIKVERRSEPSKCTCKSVFGMRRMNCSDIWLLISAWRRRYEAARETSSKTKTVSNGRKAAYKCYPPMDTNLNTITVTLDDSTQIRCAAGTRVRDILPQHRSPGGLEYVGALVSNDTVSLLYPVEVDATVTPLTRGDPNGFQIYHRSLCFLLAKAVKELYPDARFAVQHSLGDGFFCTFETNGKTGITDEQLQNLDRHMRADIKRDLPIEHRKIAFTEAVQRFEQEKQFDKYNLLRFRNPPKVATCWCENFSDLAHGPLAASTGALSLFKLILHPPGFVLQFPEQDNPKHLRPFKPQPQLFQIFQEHKEWGRILGVSNVGRLNEIIANKEIGEFIRIAEAFHEKKNRADRRLHLHPRRSTQMGAHCRPVLVRQDHVRQTPRRPAPRQRPAPGHHLARQLFRQSRAHAARRTRPAGF